MFGPEPSVARGVQRQCLCPAHAISRSPPPALRRRWHATVRLAATACRSTAHPAAAYSPFGCPPACTARTPLPAVAHIVSAASALVHSPSARRRYATAVLVQYRRPNLQPAFQHFAACFYPSRPSQLLSTDTCRSTRRGDASGLVAKRRDRALAVLGLLAQRGYCVRAQLDHPHDCGLSPYAVPLLGSGPIVRPAEWLNS